MTIYTDAQIEETLRSLKNIGQNYYQYDRDAINHECQRAAQIIECFVAERKAALQPPQPPTKESVCKTCGGSRVDPGGLPICRTCGTKESVRGVSDVCSICDGGPGNHCQCNCGLRVFEPALNALRKINSSCEDDNDANVTREMFDALTNLGLLVKTGRNEWSITPSGEKALAKNTKLGIADLLENFDDQMRPLASFANRGDGDE